MARLSAALVVPSLFFAVSCSKPAATGPFVTKLALERWHRGDPPNEYTMTGLVTAHKDERTPRWVAIDEHCGAQYGYWGQSNTRPPSFGAIRLQVGTQKGVTFAEDSEGSGWEAPAGTLAWDTGDTLKVTATGAEAPGFEVTATVPAQVVLTSHDFASLAANQLHVPRSAPLELRWSPAQGDVSVMFMQFNPRASIEKQRMIWCVYPASGGSVSVPTTVLEHLLPSATNLSTNIYVGGVQSQSLQLEGVDLEVVTFKNEVARIQVD